MVIFLLDANPVVYDGIFSFGAALTASPAETTILALARLDNRTASVITLPSEKNFPRGRREREYSNAFVQFFPSATTLLEDPICELAEYWHFK